jgi:hypothetical protein
VDLPRRAAARATLFGLHVAAAFVGAECALIWAAFRWAPAAIVGGLAGAAAGVLAMLAYPRTPARGPRAILERGFGVFVYAVALMTAGALLARAGSRPPTGPAAMVLYNLWDDYGPRLQRLIAAYQ